MVLAVGVNPGGQSLQRSSSLFYTRAASQFHFYQPIASATQVHYRVAFHTAFIPVVIHGSGECVGITTQVTYGHRLEEQPHCVQVIKQVVGPHLQRVSLLRIAVFERRLGFHAMASSTTNIFFNATR